ncbi:hypothetical protein M422DRAFT_257916 [Sphaerobolus stellatus SS14]|uniref:Unplaced genomic scaffold SPHSTscaffold_78, whole genome shotgun sequence n=1 Tax=Sphaerobolus stellatus (strain SS14) TaxID=990650 RepID=A0A0C9UWT1_SPHS4|nr:hypothetical protein M422DRAFT_257916 [Sphaerobolus stellatus SS14]
MTGPSDAILLTTEGSHSQLTLDLTQDITNGLGQHTCQREREEITNHLGPGAGDGGENDQLPQPCEVDRLDSHSELPRQFKDITNNFKADDAKKSFDRTKLPWYSRPEPTLDPVVREMLDKKHFYLVNYKEVKHDLLGQADCLAFPDSLWHNVIVGNYINLDKVYTGVRKTVKEVCLHSEWTVAFHSAKPTILYLYPNCQEEFATYESFIIGQFVATKPDEHCRVIALNKAIRKEAARVNNCTLMTVSSFNAFGTQYLNAIRLSASALGTSSHSSLGKRR